MKKITFAVLFVIPVFYFSVSSYYHEQYEQYYVRSQDPEYIYYICALSVANGKMEVGNIDHPGTTLHYLMAASFRITHMFRSHNAPFTKDVLSHPDLYLKVFNSVMNLLIVLILFLAGFLVLKWSGNIWFALAIQFSPFATEIVYANAGRITPETFMPFLTVILLLIIFKLLFDSSKEPVVKDVISFALILTLILALKLTMAFLLLLPLIILKPWKQKVAFTIATVLIFLVFAIPVTLQIDYFWRWIKGLLLHSGNYGQGEKNVLEINQFIPNIIELYRVNRSFFLFFFLFLVSYISAMVFRKKETPKIQNRIAIAAILIILIQVLALGKQLKTTYFIPALMLLPLMVVLSVMYFRIFLPEKLRSIVPPIYILLVFILFLKEQRPSFQSLSIHYDQQNEQRMKASYFFRTLDNDAIRILVPGLIGGPVPEFSLMTSYQWSGKHQSFYKPYLQELYPNSYILYPWDKSMNYWGDELNIDGSKPVYLYFGNIQYRETLSDELAKYLPEGFVLKELFFNPDTQEAIYRLD